MGQYQNKQNETEWTAREEKKKFKREKFSTLPTIIPTVPIFYNKFLTKTKINDDANKTETTILKDTLIQFLHNVKLINIIDDVNHRQQLSHNINKVCFITLCYNLRKFLKYFFYV